MKYKLLFSLFLAAPSFCMAMTPEYEETRSLPHNGVHYIHPDAVFSQRKAPVKVQKKELPLYNGLRGNLWRVKDNWQPSHSCGNPIYPDDFTRVENPEVYIEARSMAWNGKEFVHPDFEGMPGYHRLPMSLGEMGLREKLLPIYASRGRQYKVRDDWRPSFEKPGNPEFPQDFVIIPLKKQI